MVRIRSEIIVMVMIFVFFLILDGFDERYFFILDLFLLVIKSGFVKFVFFLLVFVVIFNLVVELFDWDFVVI